MSLEGRGGGWASRRRLQSVAGGVEMPVSPIRLPRGGGGLSGGREGGADEGVDVPAEPAERLRRCREAVQRRVSISPARVSGFTGALSRIAPSGPRNASSPPSGAQDGEKEELIELVGGIGMLH